MANHCAAALCLIASVLVAVALSSTDARPTVLPEKTAAALPDSSDAHGLGLTNAADAVAADPECEDKKDKPGHHHHPKNKKPKPDDDYGHDGNGTKQQPNNHGESPYPAPDSAEQVLCDGCEQPPKTPEPPPCNSCCEEPKEPGLTCNKVHAVRDGETCYSMWQCAGLGQDDFLRFNPNVCCDNLFVGQWVCLDATCAA